MQSIIQENDYYCFLCGGIGTDEHHVFGGKNRGKSTTYKLLVKLCRSCHTNIHSAKKGTSWWESKEYLERTAQEAFEREVGDREMFRKEFERDCL